LELKLTLIHLTALNLLNAAELVASSLEECCHVISRITATQTLIIKRDCDVFGYTSFVRAGESGRLAAFPLFHVVEPMI